MGISKRIKLRSGATSAGRELTQRCKDAKTQGMVAVCKDWPSAKTFAPSPLGVMALNLYAAPNGAVSLAHRMGEGGRRPGEGFNLWFYKYAAPEGAGELHDNSPAIHGWVKRPANEKSRTGRQNGSFVPDGTLGNCGQRVPAINGWAIVMEICRAQFRVFWLVRGQIETAQDGEEADGSPETAGIFSTANLARRKFTLMQTFWGKLLTAGMEFYAGREAQRDDLAQTKSKLVKQPTLKSL